MQQDITMSVVITIQMIKMELCCFSQKSPQTGFQISNPNQAKSLLVSTHCLYLASLFPYISDFFFVLSLLFVGYFFFFWSQKIQSFSCSALVVSIALIMGHLGNTDYLPKHIW